MRRTTILKSNVLKHLVLLGTSALLLGGAAPAVHAEAALLPSGANVTTLCGDKPVIVGVSDGYGGNSWRKTNLAELKDELSRCPNVTQVLYTDAGGDPQKANSDINGLVAQGVNLLIIYPDFGDALLPALREAVAAGVAVVPYQGKLNGVPGVDFTANIVTDNTVIGGVWADWVGTTVTSGNVVFLGGLPANPSSQDFFDAFSEGLKKYPDIKLLEDSYVVTNWNPIDAQKAVTGLIAKYGTIDAVVSDYGAIALAAVKTFQQADLPVPAQATVSTSNELNCLYLDSRAADAGFDYLALDGTTTIIRFAARAALASYQGIANDEPTAVLPYVFADSAKAIDPPCDPTAPPDADLSGMLSQEALKTIFAQ